jgi:hypothetical protein
MDDPLVGTTTAPPTPPLPLFLLCLRARGGAMPEPQSQLEDGEEEETASGESGVVVAAAAPHKGFLLVTVTMLAAVRFLIARFGSRGRGLLQVGSSNGRRAGEAAYTEVAVERWRSPHHLLLWEVRGLTAVR